MRVKMYINFEKNNSKKFITMKKVTTGLMASAIAFSMLSANVMAAEIQGTFINGNQAVASSLRLWDIFDEKFYALNYPDVLIEVGSSKKALYNHFITKGLLKGYVCNSYFDIVQYRKLHPELEETLGNNWDMWASYFFKSECVNMTLKSSFDAAYYAKAHPEVVKVVGNDPEALFNHYKEYGLNNDYAGNPYFNIAKFKRSNQQLAQKNGEDWDAWAGSFYTYVKASKIAREAGITEEKTEDIYIDDQGNFVAPIEVITKYLTMAQLKEKCGDSLILLTDADGYVTFVGGRFSDIKVTDVDSSKNAIECMYELIGFPKEGRILRLIDSYIDSKGYIYYQFAEGIEEKILVNDKAMLTLGTDTAGNVTSLSSSFGARFADWTPETVDFDDDFWVDLFSSYGQTYNPGDIKYEYVKQVHQFFPVMYNRNSDGLVERYIYIDGYFYLYGLYNDMPGTDDSHFEYDYMFTDEYNVIEKQVTDYYGNTVTIPVIVTEVNGNKSYAILDKERKIYLNSEGVVGNEKQGGEWYFKSEEDFNTYNYIITAYETVCKVYDMYKEFGFFGNKDDKAIIINCSEENIHNASAGLGFDSISVSLYKNSICANFDVLAHEMGHAILFSHAFCNDNNGDSSFHEGYADIAGNLMEMITKSAGANIGNVDFEKWYIAEGTGDLPVRSMADPTGYTDNDSVQAAQVGGKNYSPTYDDSYNCHSHATIYGNICYRMYKEAGIPMDELLDIWYDILPQTTTDTYIKDVESYVLLSMQQRGLEEKMSSVKQIFEDANIDGYAITWEDLVAADGYVKSIPISAINFEEVYGTLNNYQETPGFYIGENEIILPDKSGDFGIIIEGSFEYETVDFNSGIMMTLDLPEDGSKAIVDAYDLAAAKSMKDTLSKSDKVMKLNFELPEVEDTYYFVSRISDGDTNLEIPICLSGNNSEDYYNYLLMNSNYTLFAYNDNTKEKKVIDTFNTSDSDVNLVVTLTDTGYSYSISDSNSNSYSNEDQDDLMVNRMVAITSTAPGAVEKNVLLTESTEKEAGTDNTLKAVEAAAKAIDKVEITEKVKAETADKVETADQAKTTEDAKDNATAVVDLAEDQAETTEEVAKENATDVAVQKLDKAEATDNVSAETAETAVATEEVDKENAIEVADQAEDQAEATDNVAAETAEKSETTEEVVSENATNVADQVENQATAETAEKAGTTEGNDAEQVVSTENAENPVAEQQADQANEVVEDDSNDIQEPVTEVSDVVEETQEQNEEQDEEQDEEQSE